MARAKDHITDVTVTEVGNIPSAQLNEEIKRADELHQYYILQPVPEGGRPIDMAWFEASKRAVIIWNHTGEWTYASDPEDAAQKWLTDDMSEGANPRERTFE